jgi:hypothetical protein
VLQLDVHPDLHVRPSSLLGTSTTSSEELTEHVKGVMMPPTAVALLLVLLQPLVPISIVYRPLVLV